MSLRTRLILAFLLLSVVPLSAVTLYSYTTSVSAFERAVEREATQSATDIGRRMAMVTDDVGRRMEGLFEASADDPGPNPNPDEVRAKLGPMLGDAAALVERVEFEPMSPPLPADISGAAAKVPPPRPPGPPQPPDPRRPPIVVDVGAILEQTRKEIEANGVMTPEARADMEKTIRDSVHATIARKEAMKAAAAAMAAASVPPLSVKMEGREIAIPVRRHGRELGRARPSQSGSHARRDPHPHAVRSGGNSVCDGSPRRALHARSRAEGHAGVPARRQAGGRGQAAACRRLGRRHQDGGIGADVRHRASAWRILT